MTLPKALLFGGILLTGVFAAPASNAATTLVYMTFNNGGAEIDETTGWNGTVAPGGSLASGLSVGSGMYVTGALTGGAQLDAFHVDGWHTGQSSASGVQLIVSTVGANLVDFGNGDSVFQTRVHQHPSNDTSMFNTVSLYLNNTLVGSQSYTPAGGAQTLTWMIGANPLFNDLSSATFDLRFTGVSNPSQPNRGPEWAIGDSAFMSISGTVFAIPEPSRTLLLGGGLFGLLLRRRRTANS